MIKHYSHPVQLHWQHSGPVFQFTGLSTTMNTSWPRPPTCKNPLGISELAFSQAKPDAHDNQQHQNAEGQNTDRQVQQNSHGILVMPITLAEYKRHWTSSASSNSASTADFFNRFLASESAQQQKIYNNYIILNTKALKRAQTSANAKIWNKSDPGFESGFSD